MENENGQGRQTHFWEEAEARAFIGRNADYYIGHWQLLRDGARKRPAFNWAGFFFAVFWLAYRKMYNISTIILGLVLLETVLEEFIFVKVVGKTAIPSVTKTIVTAMIAAIVGRGGNYWYYRKFQWALRTVKGQEREYLQQLQLLRHLGGTSVLKMVGVLLLCLLDFGILYTLLKALLGLPDT